LSYSAAFGIIVAATNAFAACWISACSRLIKFMRALSFINGSNASLLGESLLSPEALFGDSATTGHTLPA
jgi:hypothetical protein